MRKLHLSKEFLSGIEPSCFQKGNTTLTADMHAVTCKKCLRDYRYFE